MLEVTKSVLTFLGLLGATASGVLALLVEFKKDGRVTRWGWLAIAGLALSFVIGTASQVVDFWLDRQKASAEQIRANRPLSPFERVSGGFVAEFDPGAAGVAGYVDRATAGLSALDPRKMAFGKMVKGVTPIVGSPSGIDYIRVFAQSPFYPRQKDEPVPWNMAASTQVTVQIYRDAPALDRLTDYFAQPDPDAAFTLGTGGGGHVDFRLAQKQLYLIYNDFGQLVALNRSEKLLSFYDLAGATITVQCTHSVDGLQNEPAALRGCRMRRLFVRIADRQLLVFDMATFKTAKMLSGQTLYYLRLPDDIEDLVREHSSKAVGDL